MLLKVWPHEYKLRTISIRELKGSQRRWDVAATPPEVDHIILGPMLHARMGGVSQPSREVSIVSVVVPVVFFQNQNFSVACQDFRFFQVGETS